MPFKNHAPAPYGTGAFCAEGSFRVELLELE